MLADLPLILYELLMTVPPMLAVLFYYSRRQDREGFSIKASSFCLLVLFGLYLIGVLHVTGAGTLWNGLRGNFRLDAVNLIPFSQDISLRGYLLNILMVVPLGFLVPLLFRKMDHWGKILALGAGMSLMLEVSQLFSYRATDVDDLIMNSLGALLGYGMFRLTGLCLRGRKPPQKLTRCCLVLVAGAVFLSRFFLYDESGFLSLLYR